MAQSYIRKLPKFPCRTHDYLVCGIVECITVNLDRRLAKFVHSKINNSKKLHANNIAYIKELCKIRDKVVY